MFERFTDRARRVLVLAQEEARLLGHGFVGTEHLLLGVIGEQGDAAEVLQSLEVTPEAACDAVAAILGPAGDSREARVSPPFSPRAQKALEQSLRRSLELGDAKIRPSHLLLGVLAVEDGGAVEVLERLGRSAEEVRAAVLARLGTSAEAAPRPAEPRGFDPGRRHAN